MSEFEEQLRTLTKPGKAWERFGELGLPSNRSELYRNVRLRDLYEGTFSLPAATQCNLKQEGIVFINGAFSEELSSPPQGVTVLPLAKAELTFSAFLKSRFARLLKEEIDPFALLAHAQAQEGVFVYVAPGTALEKPLDIHHFVAENYPVAAAPRIHLFVGKGASLDVHVRGAYACGHWINSFVDCALEENASLAYTEVVSSHREMWMFEAVRATLKAHSRFQSLVVAPGSTATRHDYRIALCGQGAEATLLGVGHIGAGRHAHVNVLMEHLEPHCRSMQHFKHVLSGASRTSFEGKIYVRENAQKTEAYQKNNTLLLGDRAQSYSKPNLEIFADDVKASHGATTGQLDKEALFYLKTRGLTSEAAEELLVQGFTREILDRISDDALREQAYVLCQ